MATAAVSELHTHQKYERLIAAAQNLPALPTAVAHPCDSTSLSGAIEAAQAGLIEPLLIGPKDRIQSVAKTLTLDISRFELIDAPHSQGRGGESRRNRSDGTCGVVDEGKPSFRRAFRRSDQAG